MSELASRAKRWDHVLTVPEIIGDSALVKDHVTGKVSSLSREAKQSFW
jgi:hypothetical protein